jgi:DNA-binding transcriptional MerR regulator
MPNEYSLQELARLADVTPRTIRYYIVGGLLPAPSQSGPLARYSDTHLERLRLIKKLQGAHLPLAEIRTRLNDLDDAQIATMADEPAPDPSNSAADYIRDLLAQPDPRRVVIYQNRPAPGRASEPAPASAPPSFEPDRAQWERIALAPDIELHIRRPLTRQLNKRVERLITIARQLLEEE